MQVQNLSIGHRAAGRTQRCVAQGIDFTLGLEQAEVLCLLGANGCGKTTLLRTLLGLLMPLAGRVCIQGEDIRYWSRSVFARYVGYVPQAHTGVFPFTVEEVVLMGRAARIGRFSTPSAEDRKQSHKCLELLGIEHLRARAYTAISGGERQLTLLARALVQEPRLLVMDEPTASLDFGNQLRVLEHIERLRTQGMSVLITTHQPEHALRVADRIGLMGQGRLLALGAAMTTATPAALARLYGVSEAGVRGSLHAFGATPVDTPPAPKKGDLAR